MKLSKKPYKVFKFKVDPLEPYCDILIARLSQLPFESFEETDIGLNAYTQENIEDKVIKEILLKIKEAKISFANQEIPYTNWNEQWEKSYHPIVVGGKIRIIADFHEPSDAFETELNIQPKMSFGTGHHETTTLILEHLLEMNLKNKSVLDAGCGTGILGIYAAKKRALRVTAFDIDAHVFENAIENAQKNKVSLELSQATIIDMPIDEQYDVIIANINRNVLLQEMPDYVKRLKRNGVLILSGFIKKDLHLLEIKAMDLELVLESVKEKNNWISIKWLKK